MWPRPLASIITLDMELLVEEAVHESRHLEFKRELPHKGDSSMVPFTLEVCAFANAGGGYIVYGIDETPIAEQGQGGIASGIVPIFDDMDAAINRLSNFVHSRIQPQIAVAMKAVPTGPTLQDGFTLVIRVPSSMKTPHAVVDGVTHKFPIRVSRGINYMDSSEIRRAMVQAESATENIHRFLKVRYEHHRAEFIEGSTVLHIIPLGLEFDGDILRLIPTRDALRKAFPPLWNQGYADRYNIDGYVTYGYRGHAKSGSKYSSTQVFRNGTIEAVTHDWAIDNILHHERLVEQILVAVETYTQQLENLGTPYPIILSLALNVPVATAMYLQTQRKSEEVGIAGIFIPHILVYQKPVNWHTELKPIFDMLWNAFGLEKCHYYDEEGQYRGPRYQGRSL